MEQLEFLLKLDERMSGPASKATQALRSLESQIRKEQTALTDMEAKLAKAKTALQELTNFGDKVSIKAVRNQQERIASLTRGIEKQKGVLGQLTGALPKFTAEAGRSSVAADTMNAALSRLGLAGLTAGTVITGLIAGLAALIGVGSAFAASQADIRRSQLLSLEGMLGSAQAAKDLDKAIQNLGDRVPVMGVRLDQLGRQLALANLRGTQLTASLESLALAEGVAGQQASQMLLEVIKVSNAAGAFKLSSDQLKDSGVEIQSVFAEISKTTGKSIEEVEKLVQEGKISVADGLDAMNKAVQGKFGNVAAQQMKGLSVQMGKFKENLGKLFETVNIEPFLDGLSMVTSLFTQSSNSGQAMGFLLSKVFGSLLGKANTVFGSIKILFQEMIIAGLKIYIAIAPAFKAVSGAFESIMPGAEGFSGALKFLAEVVVTAAAVAFGLLAGTFYVIAGAISLVMSLFSGLYNILTTIGEAIGSFFTETDWGSSGAAIVEGIISGITGAAGALYDGVKNLASGAVSSFKNMLGISSPSKVFAGLGMNTAEGFAMGVDDGAQESQESVDNLVKPLPLAGGTPAAGGAGNAAGAGAGAKISIGGVTMNISGVAGAEQLEGMLPTMLVKAFEQMGITAAIEAEA